MDYKYKVTIESDGRDCDGPINHGTQVKELTYGELSQEIGFAFLSHGAGSVQEPFEDQRSTCMIFGNNHDEGFSRTTISFYELDEEHDELPKQKSNNEGLSQ